MNPIRRAAQDVYDAALVKLRAAENGTDEAAYLQADAELSVARRKLCEAEAAHPTAKEVQRQNNVLRLRNRGLDV